mmetsp:Transcript_41580/g.120396  ORF Transcript_41580/g.120396 Transcript_41580/m.120396 type:complete len:251 (-) Transcript_41580:2107-2859(-)
MSLQARHEPARRRPLTSSSGVRPGLVEAVGPSLPQQGGQAANIAAARAQQHVGTAHDLQVCQELVREGAPLLQRQRVPLALQVAVAERFGGLPILTPVHGHARGGAPHLGRKVSGSLRVVAADGDACARSLVEREGLLCVGRQRQGERLPGLPVDLVASPDLDCEVAPRQLQLGVELADGAPGAAGIPPEPPGTLRLCLERHAQRVLAQSEPTGRRYLLVAPDFQWPAVVSPRTCPVDDQASVQVVLQPP